MVIYGFDEETFYLARMIEFFANVPVRLRCISGVK